MPGRGQPWKTAIAAAMGAPRRFPTAAHHPWKTLPRFPHSHRAGGSSFFSLKPYERTPLLRSLFNALVQAHPSMRKCCGGP
jgi:hypothetical protein